MPLMSAPTGPGPILVTGGAGFVGSYTVRALVDAGFDVVVYDIGDYRPESRFVVGDDAERIPLVRGGFESWPDVAEAIAEHRPAAIVHIANFMDIEYLDRHPYAALSINVTGTVNLLEAARLNGVQRFVYFSSIGVLPRIVYEPVDGDHPVITSKDGPAWAYSTGKICGELFCYTYNRSFDLDFRIIRPSAVYGFGMSRFAPNGMKYIVEPSLEGRPVRIPSGGMAPRDYIHVADLASLVVAALQGPDDADRIFYGATGRPLTLTRDVAQIVRELVPGSDIDVVDELTDLDKVELCCRGITSIENAVSQLGWEPRFLGVREGIMEYIQRYRAYSGQPV